DLYVDGFLESISAEGDEPVDTAAGVVRIGQSPWGSRPFNGLIDDVRIYDKAFTEDEMRQTFGNVLIAWQPQPAIGASGDIWRMAQLSWTPGDGAVEHDVYLGTDKDAVAAADASDTSGIYLGRQTEAMYIADLSWSTTYYWRIDEVAADGTISTGHVWSFSTTGEIVLYDEVTPFPYDNSADPFLSEIALELDPAQDWTGGCAGGIGALAVSYDGVSAPGSVTEADGVVTVVGRGMGAWGQSDEIQYAHTTLTGDGSMIVKVESLDAPHDWTRVGIMIRESLDPGSAQASVYVSSANGVLFQARAATGQDTVDDSSPMAEAVTAPVWLKIERTFPMISASYSTDGVTWVPATMTPQVIPMTPLPIHIGLVVSANSPDSATAVFSNLSSTGGVAAGPLNSTEIGLESNAAEPMYMVLEDASGATAAALNPDPAATQLVGAQWIIDLDEYNIDRTAVAKATLVIGDLGNPAAGGSGTITINSVSLLPDCVPMAHWTFDDGSGAVAVDSSRGGGNDGTLVGDPQWAAGMVGGALDFDGVDDVVELGTLDVVGQITLAAWINADDFEINDARIITKANEWGENDHWWMLSTISETSLRLRLKTDDGQGTTTLISDPVLETGVWAHVAATWDGSMMRIYKDGVEVASQEKGGSAVAVDPAVSAAIGSQPSDAFASDPSHVVKFFDGLIDDVRIYDVALPEAEIAKLAGL
ncbi:LamG-like jellyroll fold domain-containing protein, partial [Planctomycetota bacterium]